MVMDNNGMSHKAAGMVGGGQYESKAGSVTDCDLDALPINSEFDQAVRRFGYGEVEREDVDRWIDDQQTDSNGAGRFFDGWTGSEERDALNEANANVCRRELDALGIDYHNSGKGIIVPLRDDEGNPTVGAAFMYGVDSFMQDEPVLDDGEFSEVVDQRMRDWFEQEADAQGWEPPEGTNMDDAYSHWLRLAEPTDLDDLEPPDFDACADFGRL